MIKTILKLLLLSIIYTILFIAANAALPFSQAFKELNASSDPTGLVFILISSAWTCVTMYFVIIHASWSGKKLIATILGIIFFVQYFMTQIETLFFGSSFDALSRLDVMFIMLAGLPSLLVTAPLAVRFFRNKHAKALIRFKIDVKKTIVKIVIISMIYLCVYMLFGYYVAWQFEELRLFYSGSAEKLGFLAQMAHNWEENPIIFPFQIIRGALFGLAAIPLLLMIPQDKKSFIISICLVYLGTAIGLIIPNVLFPDGVRIAHLIEMSTSMLLFGVVVGTIFKNNIN